MNLEQTEIARYLEKENGRNAGEKYLKKGDYNDQKPQTDDKGRI